MSRVVSVLQHASAIEDGLRVLTGGGVIVMPTDTVYGVAAVIDQPEAVARLYHVKGRPLARPIPVLVSGHDAVERLSPAVDDISRELMAKFWPGPLTIVVPAADWLPREIVRDTGAVGVRMPDHSISLDLIARSGGALAVTSANRSGEREAVTAAQAEIAIGERVDLIIDGGGTPGGVPSTVVRVEEDGSLTILRQGAIPADELHAAVDQM